MSHKSLGGVQLINSAAYRAKDIEYAAFLNGGERTLEGWKTLFATADAGFVLKSVTEPEGSALAILEFVWQSSV